jgi:hypothetical protein
MAFALVAGSAAAVRAEAPADAHAAKFVASRTVIWLHRSQVIPIRVGSPAEAESMLEAKVDQPGVVEILRQPTVLKGGRRSPSAACRWPLT